MMKQRTFVMNICLLLAITLGASLAHSSPKRQSDTNLEKARMIFEELLVKTPDDPDIYRYLGDIYATKRDNAKTEKFYVDYARMQPSDYYPHYRLGQIYMESGKTKLSDDEFRKGIALIDAGETDLNENIAKARMLALISDKSSSDDIFNGLMRDNPGNMDVVNTYLETLFDTDRFRDADKLCVSAINANSSDYRLRRNLARIQTLNGEYEKAHETIASLRNDYPESDEIKADYAYLLYSEEDWYAAIPVYGELIEDYPDNMSYVDIDDEIFRRYRPTLLAGFGMRFVGNEDRYGPYLRYLHPLNSMWTFEAGYMIDQNTANILGLNPNYSTITQDIDMLVRFRPLKAVSLSGGLVNQLVGSSYAPAPLLSVNWNDRTFGHVNSSYAYNRTLNDPTAGLYFDGRKDRAGLTYDKIFYGRAVFNAEYFSNWYRVNSSKTPADLGDDFGREDVAGGGLQFILLRNPEVRFGYQFTYSKLHIVNNYLDIIPLIQESARSDIIASFYNEWNRWISTDVSAFVGDDPKRHLSLANMDLYGFSIYNRLKLSKRLEISAGYEYSSEDLFNNTGRYQFVRFEVMYRF